MKTSKNVTLVAMEFYGATDTGRVRTSNQDRWIELPEEGFFALADGMGGHLAGDVAATATLEVLADCIKKNISLSDGIALANQEVYERGVRDPDLQGMGSTLCCLWIQDDKVLYAHVGDSRIYLKREGRLQQLTEDHSLIEALLTAGEISQEEAEEFKETHVVTRAIGPKTRVEPSIGQMSLIPGDCFLLCSDGLSDFVSFAAIEAIMNSCTDLKRIAQRLIHAANDAGGEDNITVLLVHVL